MPDDPSNAADKLQACLNHDWPDQDFPSSYIQACTAWFASLSNSERMVAAVARAAFNRGDEAAAEENAGFLPAAPKFPPRLATEAPE